MPGLARYNPLTHMEVELVCDKHSDPRDGQRMVLPLQYGPTIRIMPPAHPGQPGFVAGDYDELPVATDRLAETWVYFEYDPDTLIFKFRRG